MKSTKSRTTDQGDLFEPPHRPQRFFLYEELTARQRAIVGLYLMRHSVEAGVTHDIAGKAYAVYDDTDELVMEDLTWMRSFELAPQESELDREFLDALSRDHLPTTTTGDDDVEGAE